MITCHLEKMAGEEHGAEVQAYLDKHRITKLFEDLLSKVVKDLPASPVDFLISKLQAIKQRKKVASPAVSGKSKLQISGSSVSPRPKSSTIVSTKPSSLRPPGAKTSSLTPSKLPPSQSPRPTSSSIPKPGSRSGSRTPGSKVKPSVTTPTRPTTAPPNKSTPKSSATVRSKLPTSQLRTPSTRSGPTKVTSTIPKGKSKVSAGTEGKKPVSESAKEPVTVDIKPVIKENTFSSDPILDEGDEELVEVKRKDDREWSEEREKEEEESTGDTRDDFILDEIIKLRKSSTHSKHAYIQSLLAPPTGSEGYGSEDDDSEKDGELEVVEDYEALEEEGWIGTGSKKSKFAIKALPAKEQATVDLQLRICSRCARVLTEGGEGDISTAETVSMVTQVTSGEADFESASQVGSHASFPQWTGSAVSNPPLQQSSGSEVSSDVTLQSHDTWGGIAPQPRANLPPSDVESEVQLPPPAPLEGQPWSTEGMTTHADHYGWA